MVKAMLGAAAATTLALVSCNMSPVENRREEAKYSCWMMSWVVQGYYRLANGKLRPTAKAYEADLNAVDEEKSDAPEGKGSEPSFRFVDSGNFVIDYGQVSVPPIPPFELKCTGDFNAGKFTTIQVNGTIYRPPPGESWPITVTDFEE
jgi:hypothetical protein